MDVFWFWWVNINLKVSVFFVFGTFIICKFLFLRFLLKLQISIKWPWHDTRDVCHRVAWKPWSGQTSCRWWSCWLVSWLSSLGERSCRAACQRSGKMLAKGADWRRLSKCDSSFVIVVSNGSNVCFFNIPSALALTQILCGDTLSGPLWSAAASCGCPSTPSTSRRCSATSPAKPWDTQRCEHTCARCRFRSPFVEQKRLRQSFCLSCFRSLYVNMVGLWVTVSLAVFSGLTMFSIYKNCDPLSNGDVNSPDEVNATGCF